MELSSDVIDIKFVRGLARWITQSMPLILSPIHCSSIRKVLIAAGRNRTKYRRSSSIESRIHQPKSLSWKEHGKRPTIRRDQAVVKQATLSLEAIRTIQWICIRNNLERFLSYVLLTSMPRGCCCFPICKHLVLQSSSIHLIWKNKNRNYNSINNISDWGSFGLPVIVWT